MISAIGPEKPFALPEPVAYLQGHFLPASQARISVYDFGLVLGATITDLLRTFRHQPYRLEEHVRRFFDSCAYARISPPISPRKTVEVTGELIDQNKNFVGAGDDLGIVYFVTPGENQIYAGSGGTAKKQHATFCIHSFPLPFVSYRKFFTRGIHLVIPSTRQVPSQCVDSKAQNRSRIHWWLAEQEAHLVDPDASPLLLDVSGNLTEAAGANFLLVKDGVVLSPTPRNILLGVSRKVVIEICTRLRIRFEERDLQMHDALTADEAFVTATPYCMAPVTKINGVTIGSGGPGLIFERILAAFNVEVGLDIRAQITARR